MLVDAAGVVGLSTWHHRLPARPAREPCAVEDALPAALNGQQLNGREREIAPARLPPRRNAWARAVVRIAPATKRDYSSACNVVRNVQVCADSCVRKNQRVHAALPLRRESHEPVHRVQCTAVHAPYAPHTVEWARLFLRAFRLNERNVADADLGHLSAQALHFSALRNEQLADAPVRWRLLTSRHFRSKPIIWGEAPFLSAREMSRTVCSSTV